jgi:hypothetical protein
MSCSTDERVHISVFNVKNDIDSGNLLCLNFSEQVINHFNDDITTKIVKKVPDRVS